MNKIILWLALARAGFAPRRPLCAGLLAGGILLGGCGRAPEIAEIRISPNPVPSGSNAVVALSLRHPREGMAFEWWASSGTCNPPTTSEPWTRYEAPPQSTAVRLKVTLVRKSRIQSVRETLLRVGEVEAPATLASPADPGAYQIRLTTIPPYDAQGMGAPTNKIAGRVDGLSSANPQAYRVVLYAKTIDWWVQPRADQPLTLLAASGEFEQMIHKGGEYAVLLVTEAFTAADAPSPTPVLPRVDGVKVLKEVRVNPAVPRE